MRRLLEVDGAFHRGCAEQPPVEPIAPVVVRARELRRVTGAFGDDHAAVPADGAQHANLAVLVTRHEQWFADDLERIPITGIRELVLSTDAEPLVAEDRVSLELEELVRRV